MSQPITILIVDDHTLFRESLRQMLEREPDLSVVGTAADAELAIAAAEKLRPDVVLMDIDMPGLISFDAADRIMRGSPPTRVIFLSAFFHDSYIEQALAIKARGYLTKSEPPANVVDAIRQVAAGDVCFSPEVRNRIVAGGGEVRLARPDRSRAAGLSRREVEVLRYLARGMSKKQIAGTMHVSVKTVEGHAQKVMNKLDIHDRVALSRFAIREGIIEA